MPKLELSLLVGAESKEWLSALENTLAGLEKVAAKLSDVEPATSKLNGKKSLEEAEEEFDKEDGDADEDFAPKKAAKKAAVSSFDEDEEQTQAAVETEEDDNFTDKPVSKKAKKLTVDDVNDACKKRAAQTGGKEGRNEVLTILKKKFKTQSVSELKPEQYASAIAAMGA